MSTARLICLLAGGLSIGAGVGLVVTGWAGGPDLQAYVALGYSAVAVGIAIVLATSLR